MAASKEVKDHSVDLESALEIAKYVERDEIPKKQ